MTGSPPQHWIPQTGPYAWFQVWHPPSWHLETSDRATSLAIPGGGGILTISSFWVESNDRRPQLASLADPAKLFTRHRNVRQIRTLNVGDESISFEGEAPIEGKRSWWKLLGRSRWKKFRLWCIRQGNVHLLALYMQTEEFDPESATMAEMVLNTVQFADPPAMPPELFARRVVEFARQRFPAIPLEVGEEFQLKIREKRINLRDIYRLYVQAPDQFEYILSRKLTGFLTGYLQNQNRGQFETEPEFEQIRDQIMPMLYSEHDWREHQAKVMTEWAAGLVVTYVVDESQSYWYIRPDLLERWNVSKQELHEIALANLERYFEDHPMELTVAGDDDGPRLMIPSRPDIYNATRLLSSKFHDNLRLMLGREFAVGAPNRDSFVAMTLTSEETVERVRKQVSDGFHKMDHPLSDRLLLFTYDGVSEYRPWDDDEGV